MAWPIAWSTATRPRPSTDQQALGIYLETKNRAGEAAVLTDLGNLHRMTGSPEEGVELHRRTIQIYRELENRAGEATSLYSLGHSYYALGRYEEALECYTQAVPIAREVEDPEAEGIALNRIGMVHRMLNRPRDAVRYHLHALQIMRDAKIALNEGRILYQLMLDWKALSQPQLAIYYGKQSINVQQTIRSGLRSLDEESQQSFIKDKEEIYRDLADMLITARPSARSRAGHQSPQTRGVFRVHPTRSGQRATAGQGAVDRRKRRRSRNATARSPINSPRWARSAAHCSTRTLTHRGGRTAPGHT